MNHYTTQEKIQIVKWCLGGNSFRRTCELFSVFYENRPIPCASTVKRIVDKFENTGCVNNECKQTEQAEREIDEEDLEIDILAAVEQNPNISIRTIAEARNVSHTQALKI